MSDLVALLVAAAVVAALVRYLARKPKHRKPGLPAGISVHFTKHAHERMTQRGITSDQVTWVLIHPERQKSDPIENSVRLERDLEGRTLKVWVAEPWPATSQIVVKTTAWQYFATIKVPVERVGLIIGRGGATIRQIEESAGARISVSKTDGTVDIRAGDLRALETAREQIQANRQSPARHAPWIHRDCDDPIWPHREWLGQIPHLEADRTCPSDAGTGQRSPQLRTGAHRPEAGPRIKSPDQPTKGTSMTGNNAVATPAIVEGRILDLQSLREVRGGKTSDVSTAEAAFKRVAEKEKRIDFLVNYMSAPCRVLRSE